MRTFLGSYRRQGAEIPFRHLAAGIRLFSAPLLRKLIPETYL